MVLPKSNISIMMVRNALNYPSTDLGTLCSCGEKYINKWSKYKPVPNPFTNNRPSDWWRGSMRNCGIGYLSHFSIHNLISSIDSGVEQLPYDPPHGGSVAPFRLGDFAGYNSEARPPIQGGSHEGTYYKNNPSIGFAALLASGGSDSLTLSDIFETRLDNMYYGVALKRPDNTLMWITSSSDVKNGGSFIEFPTSNLNADTTYSLYQFLSSYKKPSLSTSESAGTFVAIPGEQKQAIKIMATNVGIYLINLERSSRGVVTGNIRIENKGSFHTFRNIGVHIRYGTSRPEDTLKVGESIVKLDDIEVQMNETKTVPFSSGVNALPDFSTLGGKVFLYMDNQLKAQGFIFQQSS